MDDTADYNVGNGATGEWRTVGRGNRFGSLASGSTEENGGRPHGGHEHEQRIKRQRQASSFDGGYVNGEEANNADRGAMPLSEFRAMNLEEKLDTMFTLIQSTAIDHAKLTDVYRQVGRNTHELHRTVDRISVLEYRAIDLEARSRRNNLLLRAIPEEINEDSMQVVKRFLADRLNINKDVYIQQTRRVGRRQYMNRSGRGFRPAHRPIIVELRDYQDLELIMSNAKLLANTPFGISRDYPPEIADARKELYPRMKALRSENPRSDISIQFPAKLVKDRTVVKDMFPDWRRALTRSKHVTSSSHGHSEPSPYIERNDTQRHENIRSTNPSSHTDTLHTTGSTSMEVTIAPSTAADDTVISDTRHQSDTRQEPSDTRQEPQDHCTRSAVTTTVTQTDGNHTVESGTGNTERLLPEPLSNSNGKSPAVT